LITGTGIEATNTLTTKLLSAINAGVIPQAYIKYSTGNEASFYVNSAGELNIATTGGVVSFDATDLVKVLNTTNTTDATNQALIVSGGIGCKRLFSSKHFITDSTLTQLRLGYDDLNYTNFNVSSTGDITINATGNNLNFHATDHVEVLNTTASTSQTTGALVVDGGLGVSGDIYASSLNLSDTTASTSKTTGALIVAGGIGCNEKINCDNLNAVVEVTSPLVTATAIEATNLLSTKFFSATNAGVVPQLYIKYSTGNEASFHTDSASRR
jgi:hypothetical protein